MKFKYEVIIHPTDLDEKQLKILKVIDREFDPDYCSHLECDVLVSGDQLMSVKYKDGFLVESLLTEKQIHQIIDHADSLRVDNNKTCSNEFNRRNEEFKQYVKESN